MFKWLFGSTDAAIDTACQKHMHDLRDTLVDMKVPQVKVPDKGWFISAVDGKVHDVNLESSQWNPFGGSRNE